MEHIFKLGSAAGTAIQNSAKGACGNSCGNSDLAANFASITNILMFILGSIAVIMIVVGGLRFVTSNGDPKQAEAARNTILYSVIGLVVAMLAYAIVNFVAGKF
jgi:hypothetical protein